MRNKTVSKEAVFLHLYILYPKGKIDTILQKIPSFRSKKEGNRG